MNWTPLSRQISSEFKLRPLLPSQQNSAALLLRGEYPLLSYGAQKMPPARRRTDPGYSRRRQ
jgi:hypothetical protein